MRVEKTWTGMAAALLLAAGTAGAQENLLKDGVAENSETAAKWGNGTVLNKTDKKSGEASFENSFEIRNFVFSPGFVEIDPLKTYKAGGFFKAAAPGKTCKTLFGVRFYDADKRELGPCSVLPLPNTETTLAADAKKGGTTLRTAEKDWKCAKGVLCGVAFNVKDNYADLPNHESARVTDFKEGVGGNEVTLRKPLDRSYPAGTKIRLHKYIDYPGATYDIPSEWTERSMTFSGESKNGAPEKGKFWSGAKYLRVHILANFDKTSPLLFDDISVTESK